MQNIEIKTLQKIDGTTQQYATMNYKNRSIRVEFHSGKWKAFCYLIGDMDSLHISEVGENGKKGTALIFAGDNVNHAMKRAIEEIDKLDIVERRSKFKVVPND